MIKDNYSNDYVQVLETLNNLNKEDFNKIPKEYIKFLEENSNKDYEFQWDYTKSLKEQNLSENAKLILFFFFEEFGANEEQQRKINKFKISIANKNEIEKANKYNSNIIFIKQKNNSNIMQVNEKALVKYKVNVFQRFKNYILNLLNIN